VNLKLLNPELKGSPWVSVPEKEATVEDAQLIPMKTMTAGVFQVFNLSDCSVIEAQS
jgi:hypothetical protein